MSDPTVRIVLEDGTNTWVVMAPVKGWDSNAVYEAMTEATRLFHHSIFREEKEVEQHLRRAIADGIQ